MAEQNVVKMSDADEPKGSPAARCLSELVGVTMSKAAARLSSVDEDVIFREATARAGIRDFALALEAQFPDMRAALSEQFTMMAAELGSRSDNIRQKPGLNRAGGAANAERQKSSGLAGG